MSQIWTGHLIPIFHKQGGKCWDISVIYCRYVVYRKGSTRYFLEKNRRGDISANIAKISAIYWRYIRDKSLIFWRYFPSFMQHDLMAQITPVLIRRPKCDSNGNMAIQRLDCSQFFIQWPKLICNGKLTF